MSSRVESRESGIENLPIVDGEILEDSLSAPNDLIEAKNQKPKTENQKPKTKNQIQYVFLPLLFLTVALLGGLRLDAADASFIFLRPALICLVFAVVLLILFFRARLIRFEGWFSEDLPTRQNVANATVLLALFAASAQIFNSLLPERGLPFWVVAFCFFWTLWNNLFADFDVKKLLRSLGGLFGLAFVVKYLVLANLAAPVEASWWRRIIENPAQETFTWLLDLPRFSAGTGYIQFFAVIFYLLGLFLLPTRIENAETRTK